MGPSDILSAPLEEQLTLLELARERNLSPPSTWRWAVKGVDGVKLPTAKIGHKRVTSRAAFVWWVEQLTALADGERLSNAPAAASREGEIERAEYEAARMLGLTRPAEDQI
jgi:hypothetical protein